AGQVGMVRIADRAVVLDEDDSATRGPDAVRQPVQAANQPAGIMPARGLGERTLLHVDDDQRMSHGHAGLE
ncbi:MAG TPA: hypothetical protein VJ890_10880, partial [Vineibacter sp.]|nr:hypothetical protein [Vineibacter sp.]